MQIRRAEEKDYPAVRDFYYAITDEMADSEFKPGWERDVYPTQAFLQDSIRRGELYIGLEDGAVAGCMIVNGDCNDGYRGTAWGVEAGPDEVCVIHALGVRRALNGRGLAGQLTQYALDEARSKGLKAVRLDVLEENIPAERAYTRVGFVYRGTVRMFYEDTGWTNYRLFEYVL